MSDVYCITKISTDFGEYIYHKESYSYNDTIKFCNNSSSQLAVIPNNEVYESIVNNAPKKGDCYTQYYRIGLASTDYGSTFHWIDGTTSDWYQSFNGHPQSDRLQTVSIYLSDMSNQGLYRDSQVSALPFVCYKPTLQTTIADSLTSVTTPSILQTTIADPLTSVATPGILQTTAYTTSSSPAPSSDYTGLGVAVIAATIVLLLIFAAILFKRRRNNANIQRSEKERENPSNDRRQHFESPLDATYSVVGEGALNMTYSVANDVVTSSHENPYSQITSTSGQPVTHNAPLPSGDVYAVVNKSGQNANDVTGKTDDVMTSGQNLVSGDVYSVVNKNQTKDDVTTTSNDVTGKEGSSGDVYAVVNKQ